MNDKVFVIGVGDDGAESLGRESLALIQNAEILFGGERHLEFFNPPNCEKVTVKSNLKEVAVRIHAELGKKKMVVLASGDPLFYGIGKYILTKVPKEKVHVLPYVSAMQMAFARVKESWEDAVLVSLHAKPLENLLSALTSGEPKKVGIFTDDVNTPNAIAKALIESGNNGFSAYVCENLGGKDEQITYGNLAEIAQKTFASLNVMILIRVVPSPWMGEGEGEGENATKKKIWTLGISDLEFYQRTPEKGLITKSEVRVVSLSKMNIHKDSTVWDIGAGSGSVSIESALLAPQGKVFAIEKNAEDFNLIQKNIEKFKTSNVQAIHGLAPEALASISDNPDAVFVGGSAGSMFEILKVCSDRLKAGGRIVVNVITMENFSEAWESFKKLGMQAEVTLLQTSRSQPILDMTRLSALNPIFIINAKKGNPS
jgi:precorrin-6Y C5,15-methyltransferase (decarboxylating)